jgi:hypothetical protein
MGGIGCWQLNTKGRSRFSGVNSALSSAVVTGNDLTPKITQHQGAETVTRATKKPNIRKPVAGGVVVSNHPLSAASTEWSAIDRLEPPADERRKGQEGVGRQLAGASERTRGRRNLCLPTLLPFSVAP